MSYNDPRDVESVLEVSPNPQPTLSGLTPVPEGAPTIGAPGLVHAVVQNAAPPPSLPPGIVTSPNPAGNTPPSATKIGDAPTPGIISSTTPTPVPAPTLATSGPVQGTPAARIAGAQLVPPAVTQPTIATQLQQPANAPQVLSPISTMRQG